MVVWLGFAVSSAQSQETIVFEKEVRPILKAQCFHCHGEEEEIRGGLDVRLVRLMLAGGDSGKALEPGNAEASVLWQRIRDDEMPEGPKKLTAEQKEKIRLWIEQGAKTSRAEPENPNEARITEEELEYWAFRPVQAHVPPAGQANTEELTNPIDAFIGEGLAKKGLGFSPQADHATLLRRVTYDLTGLPPTPEEIESFLGDENEDAYERVVDRLLASPEFGVRWGRAWLDVQATPTRMAVQGAIDFARTLGVIETMSFEHSTAIYLIDSLSSSSLQGIS